MNSAVQNFKNNEENLVSRAVNGDLDAFNQIVLSYQDMAYNHALALLGDSSLAEDVTQESFIKAFEAIKTFRGGSMRGWLLKIVANSAYDLFRRSRRHPIQPLFPEDENDEEIESPVWLADPEASVQVSVERNEFCAELYQAIDSLPDAYRSVLLLVDLHELDYVDAAQALKVPLGTVKSRLARARLKMKEKLLQNDIVYSRAGTVDLSMAL